MKLSVWRPLLTCLYVVLHMCPTAGVVTWTGPTSTFTVDASDANACDSVGALEATGVNAVNDYAVVATTPNGGGFGTHYISDAFALKCTMSDIIADAHTSYTVNLSMSDDVTMAYHDLTVNVINLPTLLFTSPTDGQVISIDEDIGTGGSVIALSASKGSVTTGFTFSTTNNKFSISSDELQAGSSSFDVDSSGALSSYSVELSVTDGSDTTTITVTVEVADVNDNTPVITNTLTTYEVPIPDQSSVSSGLVLFTVTATDGDKTSPNNAVTFSISGSTLVSIGPNSGEVTLVQDVNAADIGVYDITVTASDGSLQSTKDFSVNIVSGSTTTASNDNSCTVFSPNIHLLLMAVLSTVFRVYR